MSTTKHLVIGLGEVGGAIFNLLEGVGYDVVGLDIEEVQALRHSKFEIIHVCFPFSENFIGQVGKYSSLYLQEGGLVTVHSTVPVGITSQIAHAVHSPVRGVHPNLEKGIITFVKYFGGPRANEAANYFKDICPVKTDTDSRNTEALKLWDTTQYGWQIILEKGIHEFCEKNNLDFDLIYTHANESYNKGYAELGRPEVIRPVLRHYDGKIGGHCVVQNCAFLEHHIPRTITEINESL